MTGLKKLLDSYKGAAFLICIVIVGGLVALNKVTYEQFVTFVKWALGFTTIGRSIQEGAKRLGAGKVAPAPVAEPVEGD